MPDKRLPDPRRPAALLYVRNGRLLTTWDERFAEFYTLPVGAIRAGESAEAAARRERHEETGQVVVTVKLCGVVENFFTWQGHEGHELGFSAG